MNFLSTFLRHRVNLSVARLAPAGIYPTQLNQNPWNILKMAEEANKNDDTDILGVPADPSSSGSMSDSELDTGAYNKKESDVTTDKKEGITGKHRKTGRENVKKSKKPQDEYY